MPTIAVFGAGPGLGRSIARTYGKAGHEVALVARTQDKLDALAEDLRRQGVHAHAVAGDLSDPADMPALAERIREAAGDPDVIYYAPTSADMTFVSAAELTPATIEATTSLLVMSFAALIQEFLPHMLARHRGAILTAQGATALTGTPRMSGPGPAMAAQRNYLQALGKELEGQGCTSGGPTSPHSSPAARSTRAWRPRGRRYRAPAWWIRTSSRTGCCTCRRRADPTR
jgi:short-subunit dehydrogenase